MKFHDLIQSFGNAQARPRRGPFTGVSTITLHSNKGVQSITVHTQHQQA